MKATLFILAALFSSTLWAQGAPSGAQITNVITSGRGCQQASANAALSPDNQTLSILFDNFVLSADGSNVNPANLRAEVSCTANVGVRIPYGWQMALVAVDYRGFAAIPDSAVGYQRFLYQGPGMPITSMRDATFRGPYNDNYSFTAQQKPGRYAFTTCGATSFTLPMTAVLGVYYPRRGYYPQAEMALDSQDFSMSTSFQVLWRRCM